jgi:anti-anti-sigma factor
MSTARNDLAPTLLSAIGDAIPDAILFALDRGYQYTFFNKKHAIVMKAIWGVDIGVGLSMLEVIGLPEDRAKAKANFDHVMTGERVRMIEAYGDEALQRSYWDNIYDPIVGSNGDVIGVLVQCFDISEKKRNELIIEQQRRELEQLIEDRTQQLQEKLALIQQLSAPIIPIWDGVLVVPLIGGLDEERGERVTNDVLDSIQRLATREILLDITGLRKVDTTAAERLLRTISAARLLGAGCAIVGVSPDVARTLVQIDAPLAGVPTYGTLRDGLRAALRKMAFEVVRRGG